MIRGATAARLDPALHKPESKGRTWAVVVTIGIHVLLGLIFMLVIVLPSAEEEPEVIVEVVVPQYRPGPELPKRNAIKQFNKTTAISPPSPLTRMMMAEIDPLLPEPEMLDAAGLGDTPMGFGADAIEDELVALGAQDLKGGPKLFGLGTVAERVVIVVDYTESMARFERVVSTAVGSCLRDLSPSVRYQVVINGGQPGPVRFIDSSMGGNASKPVVRWGKKSYPYQVKSNPAGKKYFAYTGNKNDLPSSGWLRPSPLLVARHVGELQKQRAEFVSNRVLSIQAAHQLKPAPDVIYVISNGWRGGDKDVSALIQLNRQKGRPVIHAITLGTGNGVTELEKLTSATGGKTIVVYGPGGEAVDGETFLANPAKFIR